MPQGLVSFTGITNPKGCVYTQTLGVHPDKAALRCVPQAGAVPAFGDITLTYNAGTLILPNCALDDARVVVDVSDGFILSAVYLDRRWRWHKAAPISGYYNVRRAGTTITSKAKTLRQLATILFLQMGESSADVSALSASIYPEVRWDCVSPALALDTLLREFGCSVSLGFGSENPVAVIYGAGSTPGTTGAMMISSSVDPKIRPHYARVCFGPSIMQARFKLEPVCAEADGTWVTPASATYAPAAGWSKENPQRLPTVQEVATPANLELALASAYRAYRVENFASGTLSIPNGSGTLTDIQQAFPLFNRLLDAESIRDDGSLIPFRIFGRRLAASSKTGQPAVDQTSTIDDEIVGEKVSFDGETGILIFEKPQYYVDGGFQFADLYLECTFGINDPTSNYPIHYEKDTVIDAAGYGYHSVPVRELEARAIVTYGAGQGVVSTATNQTTLDSTAATIAAVVASQYSTTASRMIIYNEPQLALRCNGLVHQVQHIISDGTQHAGSFSTVAINFEFDRAIPTFDERSQMLAHRKQSTEKRFETAKVSRKEQADD